MDLLSVIRRWHFRQGMPIREIERRTALSRNTIRKYLRSDNQHAALREGVVPGPMPGARLAGRLVWPRQFMARLWRPYGAPSTSLASNVENNMNRARGPHFRAYLAFLGSFQANT
jgi:hypothetical protein